MEISTRKEEREKDASKFLKIVWPLWICNLIMFIFCLFMLDHARSTNAWYTDSFGVLATTFGLSKIALSIMVLFGVCKHSNTMCEG